MANCPKGLRSLTQLVALAASALIGCTTGHLSEERYGRLTRLDERVVKGIGIVLYGPQPLTFGPQRIVVTLSVGSRVAMSNVSAIWLMYRPPGSAVQHTVRMFPVGDYIDAFGAVVPFTETGLWDVSIQVYRVCSVPAKSTFGILCCDDAISQEATKIPS